MDEVEPYVFTSTVSVPGGLRVTTTIELPAMRASARAIADSAELAHTAVSNCVKQIEYPVEVTA